MICETCNNYEPKKSVKTKLTRVLESICQNAYDNKLCRGNDENYIPCKECPLWKAGIRS